MPRENHSKISVHSQDVPWITPYCRYTGMCNNCQQKSDSGEVMQTALSNRALRVLSRRMTGLPFMGSEV